jgi:glycosyltransferase involved in cell wall biosynthesis
MHILLLTYEFHPGNGGVGNASEALCDALRRHCGYRVSVIVCRSWWPWEDKIRREKWNDLEIRRIKYTGFPEERPFRQSVRTALCASSLLLQVLRLRPDVIVSQRVYDLGLFGGALAKLCRARSITYAHGPDDTQHLRLRPRREALAARALRWNDLALVTNGSFRDILKRLEPAARIEVLPNIVGEPEIPRNAPTSYNAARGGFHLACAGRMVVELGVETKGFSHAIRALPELPDCFLHFYGDGEYTENLRALARELDVEGRVEFHGKLSRPELHAELRRADALLHPAVFEGLPMVLLEAMKLGVPVIATEVGGIPDVIKDRETGFLIRPESAESIADTVSLVRNNPELLKQAALQAHRFIDEYANAENVARRFEALLESCAVDKRKRARSS